MSKNYDPRMHTAEHILNQTMVRVFGCGRSFSTHLEKKKSKCDYRFDRTLTAAEIADLEMRVNDVIASDVQVREEILARADAEKAFNLERVPEGAGDSIRIIRVGDYDACPCIGAHVRVTGEIGRLRIISTRYDNGVLRIRFRLDEPDA